MLSYKAVAIYLAFYCEVEPLDSNAYKLASPHLHRKNNRPSGQLSAGLLNTASVEIFSGIT